jgi:Ca-activated chloride channel homolog
VRPTLLVAVVLCPVLSAQTFKSTVDQVAIPVTIQTGANQPVLDLQPTDFRVFDDGRPVAIVAFGRMRQPLHVLLLLDTSRSMMQSLTEVAAAADAVIGQLAPDDSFQVGTFSNSLRMSPVFSADDMQVATRLSLVPGANTTALYDALVEGCGVFTGEKRRAIFVVSDGTDTASSASARTAMQRAAETNVSIHAVGIGSRYTESGKSVMRAPDPVLREIAEDSGGGYVNAGTGRDFAQLFARMIEELRREYILGFTPARADGRLHSIVVTTRRPNMKVRARKHYLAPSP